MHVWHLGKQTRSSKTKSHEQNTNQFLERLVYVYTKIMLGSAAIPVEPRGILSAVLKVLCQFHGCRLMRTLSWVDVEVHLPNRYIWCHV